MTTTPRPWAAALSGAPLSAHAVAASRGPAEYDDRDRFLWSHTAHRLRRELGLTEREVDDAVMAPWAVTPAGHALERRVRGRAIALVDPMRGVIVAVYARREA